MIEKNKKANIQDELKRAEDAAVSAELLFNNGLVADAISRLYYAVFHMLRGLLLTKGLQPKTHEGALTLFSLHFVREGLFAAADGHIVARLMKYREEADYNSSYVFTENDYRRFKKEGDHLCSKIRRYLRQDRYA